MHYLELKASNCSPLKHLSELALQMALRVVVVAVDRNA